MKLTWTIEAHGAGEWTGEDVNEAAGALAAAVRDAYGRHDTETLVAVLTRVVAPLRAQLVTDGRYEVERGNEWHGQAGGIFVALYPN